MIKGISFLEDIRLILIDENGTYITLFEDVLRQCDSGLDNYILGMKFVSIALPDECFLGIVEERW